MVGLFHNRLTWHLLTVSTFLDHLFSSHLESPGGLDSGVSLSFERRPWCLS